MKKILFYLCLINLIMSGCDIIDQSEYLADYTPQTSEDEDIRNILLEDYTGIRCVRCPEAAEKIRNLQKTFGDRLIAVSIHAGHFARPIGSYDLQCKAGDEYNSYFKITGNPKGIINRTPFGDEISSNYKQWDAILDKLPLETSIVMKKPIISYQPDSRKFSVQLEIKNKGTQDTSYSLLLWLVEDGIVTPQETGQGRVYNYTQHHVLRDALNGTWGENIELPVSGKYVSTKKEYTLLPAFNADACSVVVLIYNNQNKEVMQVTESIINAKS